MARTICRISSCWSGDPPPKRSENAGNGCVYKHRSSCLTQKRTFVHQRIEIKRLENRSARGQIARHSLDSATDKIFPHISHSSSSPHDHAVFCLVLRASVLSLCFLHHCNLIINFFNLPFKAQDCLFFKLSQQQKLLLFGQSPAF